VQYVKLTFGELDLAILETIISQTKLPAHKLFFFIKNFASEQGLSPSGTVPQFKIVDVQLLLSSETKASIWLLCKASANKDNSTAVSYSKFLTI